MIKQIACSILIKEEMGKHCMKRLVIKEDEKSRVFEECHSADFSGHAGRDNTIRKIKQRYYWPDYYKDTVEMVRRFSLHYHACFFILGTPSTLRCLRKACEMSEEVLADLGRGGKRGYLAFRELTTEKEGETQEVENFRQSLNTRLEASEALSSALEEQLTRGFPKHLRWDRNAVASPTVKTIAHRMTYVTGEILRRFKK